MKVALSAILFFLSAFHLYGQVIVKPLEYNHEQAQDYKKNSTSRILAVGDTINIPFFDDFTSSSLIPDPSKWVQNGGTYINNSFAIDPPNFNVATFDGIRASGVPYNTSNLSAIGAADNLTSKPIDLSVLQNGDSVYLRFFWQGTGLGERPNPATDSIRLQIKNRSGIWKTMWKQVGDSTAFNYQLVRIGDSAQYFFKGFQFRYQSYGRLSGSYDVWNVDYIYLDTGALAKDNWSPDISFSEMPTSILKNYTAMPLQQYLPKINQETADTVWVTAKSLTNKTRVFTVLDSTSYLKDIKNNVFIDTIPDTTIGINAFTKSKVYWKVDKSKIPSTNIDKLLKYKFTLKKSGGDPTSGVLYDYFAPGDKLGKSDIDFTANDSVSRITYITDYYSYDDGSAEFGLGVNQTGAKLAVQFNLNVLPDTLTHVKIYFPRTGTDKTGEPITIRIWKNVTVGTSTDVVLYSETFALNHSSAIDNFYTYKLDVPVVITDPVIYIGYQQSANQLLLTGFDVNTNTNDKIFFNVNNQWHALTEPISYQEGSLMIRPVFRDATIVGVEEKHTTTELDCEAFPNPTQGELFITGKVKNAILYELTGRLIQEKAFDIYTENKSLDLSSLSNGFYILHLENEGAKSVKKIIISR